MIVKIKDKTVKTKEIEKKAKGTLTEEELEKLLKVPTTVAQARVIKARNIKLYKKLHDIQPRSDKMYGCPHCMEVNKHCSICAWQKYPELYRYSRTNRCLKATFGGIKGNPMDSKIKYRQTDEELAVWLEVARHEDQGRFLGYVKEAETVLLGHIEWADKVIELGGT